MTFCDKVIKPSSCIANSCPYLYTYEEERSGSRFMGCMRRVFRSEIDLDAFLLAERSGGFGGIKMSGQPLSRCDFEVEQAFSGEGPAHECVNQRFFDCSDEGPEGLRAFDLRNALT